MKHLQKSVFRNFIIVIILLFFVMSLTDPVFTMLLESRPRTHLQLMLFTGMHLTFDIALIVVAAYLFWRQTKQAFERENKRQREAENLLYASIVHDIKTPMTSVKGYTRALADGKVSPDEEAKVLQRIEQKSDQVTMLLDELFLYTNLSAGAPLLHKERTDLVTLIQEVISDAYDVVEANAIELNVDLPQTPLYAEISKKEMRRLVANLFQNAIRHNKPKTRIQVRLRLHENDIELAIADDGETIPKAIQEHVFRPFVKQDDARSSAGNGLGLAIADSIAKAHGAGIEITDAYPGYTKAFVLRLPEA